jgi:DNA helicase-2/ATP-dependent DNA helicase PcrA
MTNVSGDNLQARVQTIMNGRNRTPPTPQESGAIMLANNGGHREAMRFLQFMEADPNRRVYRWTAYKLMLEAFDLAASSSVELNEAAAQLREKRRHSGRSIPNKAVGSTLLLKGLEADHTLLLDADNPGRSRMTKEHLYVALSRGAKSVTVFSRNPTLP